MEEIRNLTSSYQSACSDLSSKEHAIADLSKQISKLESQIPSTKYGFNNVNPMEAKVTVLKELSDLFFAYGNDKPKMKDKIFQAVTSILEDLNDRKNLKNLAATIDSNTNNGITKLVELFPKISQKDLSILLLSSTGASVKLLALILNSKTTTIYSARTKLRLLIEESNLENKEQFIRWLSNH